MSVYVSSLIGEDRNIVNFVKILSTLEKVISVSLIINTFRFCLKKIHVFLFLVSYVFLRSIVLLL